MGEILYKSGPPFTPNPTLAFFCNYLAFVDGESPIQSGTAAVIGADTPSDLKITFLTESSRVYPPIADSRQHWPIVSALSLSPSLLSNLDGLKRLLKNVDFHAALNGPHSRHIHRLIDGIRSVTTSPCDWIVKGHPVRGTAMTLVMRPEHYRNTGLMYEFACVLRVFFSYCIAAHSTLQLTVINQETEETWVLPHINGHYQIM